jgi:hypothetical protein
MPSEKEEKLIWRLDPEAKPDSSFEKFGYTQILNHQFADNLDETIQKFEAYATVKYGGMVVLCDLWQPIPQHQYKASWQINPIVSSFEKLLKTLDDIAKNGKNPR